MSCPRVLLAVLLTLLHRARPFEIPSFYHKSSDVRSYFDGPVLTGSRVRLEHARDPLSEATLPTLVITDFSAQQNVWRDRPVILLVFGEHARELITTEVGLWLSHLLVYGDEQLSTWPAFRDALQEAQQHARLLGNGSPADWVGRLLSRLVFVVVLMENEAGRERVEGGNMCLRKAVSGVDLNRNWAFNWKPVKASSEEYGGPEVTPSSRALLASGGAARHAPAGTAELGGDAGLERGMDRGYPTSKEKHSSS